MDTIHKGRLAEAKVLAVLIEQRCDCYLPALGNGQCDLIAIDPLGRLHRIETKYTSRPIGKASWEVTLRQTRPNRSEVLSKKFNTSFVDMLAVYVEPIDQVQFHAAVPLEGRRSINVHARSGSSRLEDVGVI